MDGDTMLARTPSDTMLARTPSGEIRLGLSLPVFLGSLIALFSGIFPGILGVWLYAAWKIAVPEFIKSATPTPRGGRC